MYDHVTNTTSLTPYHQTENYSNFLNKLQFDFERYDHQIELNVSKIIIQMHLSLIETFFINLFRMNDLYVPVITINHFISIQFYLLI